MVLQMQLVKAIGRKLAGFVESLPGFGIGIGIASFHASGRIPDLIKYAK